MTEGRRAGGIAPCAKSLLYAVRKERLYRQPVYPVRRTSFCRAKSNADLFNSLMAVAAFSAIVSLILISPLIYKS
jgi:hypothetical protein